MRPARSPANGKLARTSLDTKRRRAPFATTDGRIRFLEQRVSRTPLNCRADLNAPIRPRLNSARIAARLAANYERGAITSTTKPSLVAANKTTFAN
jgi:hypothetical protein